MSTITLRCTRCRTRMPSVKLEPRGLCADCETALTRLGVLYVVGAAIFVLTAAFGLVSL